MQYFKKNILGILAIGIGFYLLGDTIINISDIQSYNELTEVGEYMFIEESVETNMQPSLMAGGIKVSLIFLAFLFIPTVLSIVHKRRKADKKILYVSLTLILVNFLVFPYYLTQLFSTINSI